MPSFFRLNFTAVAAAIRAGGGWHRSGWAAPACAPFLSAHFLSPRVARFLAVSARFRPRRGRTGGLCGWLRCRTVPCRLTARPRLCRIGMRSGGSVTKQGGVAALTIGQSVGAVVVSGHVISQETIAFLSGIGIKPCGCAWFWRR